MLLKPKTSRLPVARLELPAIAPLVAREGINFSEIAERTGVLLMDRFKGRFRFGFGRGFRHGFGPEGKLETLAQLPTGQSGTVVEIHGGRGMINRLSALGIRPGLRITKVGAMFMRGPITIQIGNAQVAIGFGMANRVIVEPG